ncbi:unnamed protein product [Didymodactylos carnosus]|uniref:Uncharacterized protein n=1 Tax=Didymodactylos carnosus TaxID=1234261 RepID=A0A815K3V4_9BILA|nr:unnamed protein product [Didymodactylos carnosus]CAF4282495.1 unnamed protein product [Didymodactylos carnosus]
MFYYSCSRRYRLRTKKIERKFSFFQRLFRLLSEELLVIVTGATSGIGRVCAVELAKLGAKVIIGTRDQRRADEISQAIQQEALSGKVVGYHLDLSELSTVKVFADQVLHNETRIDILLNNAGAAPGNHALTTDGLEIHFGTNHLGHFYLTQLLLPLLIRSKARVVNVSSWANYFVPKSGIDYNFPSSSYLRGITYGQSKLAQIWHSRELQRRYGEQGLCAYSLHPGSINTEILREWPILLKISFQMIFYLFGKSSYRGAQTSLYCALSDKAKPGEFHADCKPAKANSLAYNEKLAKECWDFSDEQIKKVTDL